MFTALAVAAAFAAPAQAAASPPIDEACGRTTSSLILKYVYAYDRGKVDQLDRLFAPAGVFEQYSIPAPGKRSGAAARNRATLRDWFVRRHRAGDRAQIRLVRNWRASETLGRFHFEFDRRTPGHHRGRWTRMRGTAHVRCDRRQIVRMTIRVK